MKPSQGMTDDERANMSARLYALETVLAWLLSDMVRQAEQKEDVLKCLEAELATLRKSIEAGPRTFEIEQLVYRLVNSSLVQDALDDGGDDSEPPVPFSRP